MTRLWQLTIVVVLPLALAEFVELGPWMSRRLARFAARRLLDQQERERYEEEWLADLAHCPGKLTKLVVATGYVVASLRLRRSTRALLLRDDSNYRHHHNRLAALLTVFASFISLWYLISYQMLEPDRQFLLPPPHAVIEVAFLRQANAEVLFRALMLSTGAAMGGLAIAIVLGLAMGVAMSQIHWLTRVFYPWTVLLQVVPVLALIPLIGYWFGYGMFSRLMVVVLLAISPIISTTLFGLRSTAPANHDLFTLYSASRLDRLLKLQWPAALPAVLTGVRISAGLALVAAVVGDFFFRAGEPGLGALMNFYRQNVQSEQLFGAAILSSLLGLAVFWLFGVLSRWAVGRWHQPAGDFVAD